MSTSHPCSPNDAATPSTDPPEAEKKPRRLLGPKFFSGLVAVPILIALLWFGGWPLFIVSSLAMLIGIEEFYWNVKAKGIHPFRPAGWVCSMGILVATQFVVNAPSWRSGIITICIAASVLLSMIAQFKRPAGSSVIANTGATVFGVVWVGLLFSFFLRLRTLELSAALDNIPVDGFRDRMGPIFFVMLAVWMQDNAAQNFGKLFGTRKPWPNVSPNKTLEGSAAGLLACLLVSIVVGTAFGFNTLHMIGLGLVMGVLGQLGDLCKSMIKRELGVKDFSSIIPGHGGVLDRFDSLLFAMPVAYLYFRVIVMPIW
ncbi:MAG TPA: phosphatidate cytidylyltransferase [Armatimonadota bacterium]|nr:phosphatidate cytidylyltransferase [Armatimonadota bacterium]